MNLTRTLSRLTDRHIYWGYAAATLASNALTPVVTHYQLKGKGTPEYERRLLVGQEVARKLVSSAVFLATYLGGARLSRWAAKGALHLPAEVRSKAEMVGGMLASFVGHGLVQPLLSTELVTRWMPKMQTGVKQSAASKPDSNASFSNLPLRQAPTRKPVGFQQYFQAVQQQRSYLA